MSADPRDVDFDVLELLEQRKRNAIIEECALVLEAHIMVGRTANEALAAIRALKDKLDVS